MAGVCRALSTGALILKPDRAMAKEYIEQRNGGLYIEGTRVSLDSVVHAFRRGESPEGIAECFPVLELEQIFGALTFYLAKLTGRWLIVISGKRTRSSTVCGKRHEGRIQHSMRSLTKRVEKVLRTVHEAAFSVGRRFQPQDPAGAAPARADDRLSRGVRRRRGGHG